VIGSPQTATQIETTDRRRSRLRWVLGGLPWAGAAALLVAASVVGTPGKSLDIGSAEAADAIARATGVPLERANGVLTEATIENVDSTYVGETPTESILAVVFADSQAVDTEFLGGAGARLDRRQVNVIVVENVAVVYSRSRGAIDRGAEIRRALLARREQR